MIINPLSNHILIKVEVVKPKEGLVLADNAQREEEEVASVLAVGPDVVSVGIGDYIIGRPGSAWACLVGDEKRVFIRESDVVAIVQER